MNHLRPAITMIALFTALTGIALPVAFTILANGAMPFQAGGSLIEHNGQVVGSALLGQNFAGATYFHPRPSVTTDTDPKDSSKTIPSPYNAGNSAGSNLGPTSKALVDRVKGDVATEIKAGGPGPVPGDMVTTSASGLDPDISPENAERKIARVAAARHWPEARVRHAVETHVVGRLFGLIGEPHVNVLALNMVLDRE